MSEQTAEIITIDFTNFIKLLWQNKLRVSVISLIFGIASLGIAFLLKEEFESEGKILPEFQSKPGGGLSQFAGLASLAGVDLSSMGGTEAVRPDLYPEILSSTPFFLSLFDLEVLDRNKKKMKFGDFYFNQVLDGDVDEKDLELKYPQSGNYIAINYQTEKNLKDLRERVSASIDKKTGQITISVKMPDPIVSAQVAKFSMDYLTKYVIQYRTEKSKRDVEFLAQQLQKAKGKYYNTQEKKAQYSDQFQLGTIKMQAADVQRERIESEYRLSSGMYNNLLQKYEEAKLKLQQETPVLQVLEPPVVPNKKSSPKRAIITLIGLFLGGIVSVVYVLIKDKNYNLVFRKVNE